MVFDSREQELLYEAMVIEMTGWTHEEYMNAPLALVDVMVKRAQAQQDLAERRTKRRK